MSIMPNKDEWRNFWKFVGEFKDDYPDEFLLVVSLVILNMFALALIVAIYPLSILFLLAFVSLVFGLWKLCMLFIRINR